VNEEMTSKETKEVIETGKIFKIEELMDENGMVRGFVAAIEFSDLPKLKMGQCVILQKV
jgi:hypothetical protein